MREPFGLEAALQNIERDDYIGADAELVARICRERGNKMAMWCDEIARLKDEIASLRQQNADYLAELESRRKDWAHLKTEYKSER